MPEPFVHRLRVRYAECDPQGIVFNANYFAYFDVVLTELWRKTIGPYGEMVEQGADLVVGEARARYLAPARFDDELELELLVTRMGTTGMTSSIEVKRGGEVLVEGEMRHVFVAPGTHEKMPIPEQIRRALAPHTAAGADTRAPA